MKLMRPFNEILGDLRGGRHNMALTEALADMEGRLSFRSGAARLRLDGRGRGSRAIVQSNCPHMLGFQLWVGGWKPATQPATCPPVDTP